MTNAEIQKKLIELVQDKNLAAEISGKQIPDVLKVLKENGLDIAEEELKTNVGVLAGIPGTGEISEAELEGVAGGGRFGDWWKAVKETFQGIWDGFFAS